MKLADLREIKIGNEVKHSRYGIAEVRDILYSMGSFFGMVIRPNTSEGKMLLQVDTGTQIPDFMEGSLRQINITVSRYGEY